MHVCTPISLAPMRMRFANWGCMRTSPPDSVMPPFVVRKMRRYRAMRESNSVSETGAPSFMRKVSGLWQYRQRSGQPLRKTVIRVPGPSTAVTSSHE